MAAITLTIPDNKVSDFRAGFLKEHPVPLIDVLDGEGNPTGEKENQYTDLAWFKMVILRYIIGEYKEGKRRLAYEASAVDDNIIA